MNVEHMAQIVAELETEFEATGMVEALQAVRDSLSRVRSSPSDQNQATQLERSLDRLMAAGEQSTTGRFSATVRMALEEWGVDDLFSPALPSEVRELVNANPVTLQTPETFVAERVARFEQLMEATGLARQAFEYFEIVPAAPAPGIAEIDVVIPRAQRENLDQLGQEFLDFDRIVGNVSEIATGRRQSARVSAIGSSDFTCFIEHLPEVVEMFGAVVLQVQELYLGLLDIRKRRRELEQLEEELPQGAASYAEIITAMKQHETERVTAGIESITQDLINQANASGRTINEVDVMARHSVEWVADRIDTEFQFTIRAGLQPADDAADESGSDPEESEPDSLSRINDIGNKIISIDGEESHILAIEATTSDDESGEDS